MRRRRFASKARYNPARLLRRLSLSDVNLTKSHPLILEIFRLKGIAWQSRHIWEQLIELSLSHHSRI